jgi:hypothetical protein
LIGDWRAFEVSFYEGHKRGKENVKETSLQNCGDGRQLRFSHGPLFKFLPPNKNGANREPGKKKKTPTTSIIIIIIIIIGLPSLVHFIERQP